LNYPTSILFTDKLFYNFILFTYRITELRIKNFQELKKESAEWMETLPKGQIQMYYKSNFEIIEKVLQELWKLFENTEDEELKLKVLKTIAEKRKLQVDLLDSKRLLEVRDIVHRELLPDTPMTNIFGGRSDIDLNLIK